MRLSKRFRLQASSITESIIAMVIIAICLSIIMVVYVRVLNTDRNLPLYIAEQKVKELLWETENRNEYMNEEYSYSSYTINKEVEELSEIGTYKVSFIVIAGGKQDKYQYIIAD
jgi:hypothetical protein